MWLISKVFGGAVAHSHKKHDIESLLRIDIKIFVNKKSQKLQCIEIMKIWHGDKNDEKQAKWTATPNKNCKTTDTTHPKNERVKLASAQYQCKQLYG